MILEDISTTWPWLLQTNNNQAFHSKRPSSHPNIQGIMFKLTSRSGILFPVSWTYSWTRCKIKHQGATPCCMALSRMPGWHSRTVSNLKAVISLMQAFHQKWAMSIQQQGADRKSLASRIMMGWFGALHCVLHLIPCHKSDSVHISCYISAKIQNTGAIEMKLDAHENLSI